MVTCSVLVFLEIEDSLEVLLLCEYVTIAPECELRNIPPSAALFPQDACRGLEQVQRGLEQLGLGARGSPGAAAPGAVPCWADGKPRRRVTAGGD